MVKIGIIADVHNGPASGTRNNGTPFSEPEERIWAPERRWYSNAVTRMTNFALRMESLGVDVVIDLADMVDSQDDPLSYLLAVYNALNDNYTGDKHFILGNHEISIYGRDGWGAGVWTGYTNIIPQSPPGMINSWVTGKPSGWPVTSAYSFDKCGIHFTVITYCGGWSDAEKAALLTWLDADFDASSLPIIVLSHLHLDNSSGVGLSQSANYEAVQAIMEQYNVQAVVTGHQHTVPRITPYYKTPFIYIKNEIPYFHLRGNLLGPEEGYGSELIENPDFDDGEEHWTLGNQFGVVDGKLQWDCVDVDSDGTTEQTIAGLVEGRTYRVTFTVSGSTVQGDDAHVRVKLGGLMQGEGYCYANGDYELDIKAGNNGKLEFVAFASGELSSPPYVWKMDNVSIKDMTPDTDVGKDAAFYVFTINPNAVQGAGRMKANIEVDCSYTPREDANKASMDKALDKYSVFV